MAKTFLVIACVCYCTICMHLTVSAIAAKLDDGHLSTIADKSNNENLVSANRPRSKRHDIIEHDLNSNRIEINPNSEQFVRRLFKKFGNDDAETMNVIGFERMLKELKLERFIDDFDAIDSDSSQPQDNENDNKNQTCISSVSLISKISLKQDDEINNSHVQSYNSLIDGIRQKSSTTTNDNRTAIESINSIKQNLSLTKNDFWSLCPILLYQMTAPTSLERSGCIDDSQLLLSDIHHTHHDHYVHNENDKQLVWIYASLSIIIASLCGLLGVAVIPCMERRYYNYILQFFVALAVGTLAGDALLHLMPHAMLTISAGDDGHNSMTWKGLAAALGIIFFFFTERVLTIIAEWRKRMQKRDEPASRVRVLRDPDSVSINHSLNGEKQCKHKYSSYPYCYDEIALETKDNHHQHHQHGKENGVKPGSPSGREHLCAKTLNDKANDYSDTAQSLLSNRHQNNHGDGYFKSCGEKDDVQTPDTNTVLTNLDDTSMDICGCEPKKATENYTVILREHESKHHGHSHTHGHVHSPPKTLSAVAWMVIMGDGLHNFTDGMAIGAAFSNSIAGGFSTAIAVFCHELPHELGDFAVLLKAGMSAKKAVYYNVLSSVLSFFGMVVGIIVGDTPEASAWIFACAAGMFIYIALVDMMPELTTAHNEHNALTQCILQLLGMICGVGIMLLIALYEHDLKLIFTSDDHHHHHHHNHHH